MTDIQFYFVVLIDIFYYGRGLGHTFGVRVDGPLARGFLRFLSLTAFQAEGCGLPLCGNTYNVSVTGLTFQYHMTCLPQGKVVATATKEGKCRNGS